ncbi:MAG: hypothetical protein ACOC56_04720 [Atribacterota bacterium]
MALRDLKKEILSFFVRKSKYRGLLEEKNLRLNLYRYQLNLLYDLINQIVNIMQENEEWVIQEMIKNFEEQYGN